MTMLRTLGRAVASSLAAGSLALAFPGCGGGSGQGPKTLPGTGSRSVVISILWPRHLAPTRIIPEAAQSVQIEIKQGGSHVVTKVVNSPGAGQISKTIIDKLPAGTLSAVATAFPAAQAQGNPQALGVQTFTTTVGEASSVVIDLQTTVDHLVVMPADLTVGVHGTMALTVEARDAKDAMVVIAPDQVHWSLASTQDANYATVTDSGTVTGVKVGEATLTVSLKEKSVTLNQDNSVQSVNTVVIKTKNVTVTVSNDTTNWDGKMSNWRETWTLINDGNGGITGTYCVYQAGDPTELYGCFAFSGTLVGTKLTLFPSGSPPNEYDCTWDGGNVITGTYTANGGAINMVRQP